jgi:hypothetical protein
VFERPNNAFNTQKVRLKKKKSICLIKKKKIESTFKGPKSLKMVKKKKKNTFGKSLKIKFLPKSSFLLKSSIFQMQSQIGFNYMFQNSNVFLYL